MLKNVFNIPAHQQQKIAVIGAGAMGVSTACILAQLGIAQVTLFEAESKPFNSKSASINNTGILHHFVYGGHPKTLEHLFKQSILWLSWSLGDDFCSSMKSQLIVLSENY
jgi:glycine/D-amino acid oxidase-like deaminating enzyme